MEKRPYGDTGVELSVVGFGGIIVKDEEAATASRIVGRAIERGINYFDVAPSYGNAEQVLGPALEPYRQDVFLACKTGERSKEKAWAELQQSLKHLRTDHFDLYQLHAVRTLDEVEQIMGPGGALEAFLQAREQGLVRFLGFSAHSDQAAVALLDRFDFDSVLFPFNWMCWYQADFGPRTLTRAEEKGVASLALKALAKRPWREGEERRWPRCWYSPVDDFEEASLALRFTLSKPITAAVSPSHAELLWWACDIADDLTALSDEEAGLLAQRSLGVKPIFPH